MRFGYKCDEPMAEKKFLFPCDHDCKNCVAGMKFDRDTGWVHMPAGSLDEFTDKKLYERNRNIISEFVKAVISGDQMKYTYKTRTNDVNIDVDERWVEILQEMDKEEELNERRETRRHESLDLSMDEHEWLANHEEPVEEIICRLETAEALDEAIATLTAKQRDAFMAIHFYGLNISDVARIKGLNKSTVARNLNAAEKKLKNFL